MDAFKLILVSLAGWMNRQQRHVIDYLQEEIERTRTMRLRRGEIFGIWRIRGGGHGSFEAFVNSICNRIPKPARALSTTNSIMNRIYLMRSASAVAIFLRWVVCCESPARLVIWPGSFRMS